MQQDNAETIRMMNRCKHEIVHLRATIDRLKPKAEAYDNLATILRLIPGPSIGMGEDLVWSLDQFIEHLTPKPKVTE